LTRAGAEGLTDRLSYLSVITPIIFGTTYLLTTNYLPPDRPLLAATVRSLPTGLVLILGVKRPPRGWRLKFLALSFLYCSAVFPLLFIAAARLPGGVAAVVNSITPIVVVVLSVPWLHTRIRATHVIAGLLAVFGVALLVLRSSARLDAWGLVAMTAYVIMYSAATVLTKRWGWPAGMSARGFTGWTFLIGGLTLLPVMCLAEGLPEHLSARNLGGLVYLFVFSGVVAYTLWFWGLERLPATSVSFLSLVNPVVAAALGWVILGQRLNTWQLLGAVIVLASVLLGQDLSSRRRIATTARSGSERAGR